MSLSSISEVSGAGSFKRGRLLAAALATALLASVLSMFAPASAHAATVTEIIDGITYTADDTAVWAGATATDYNPAGPMGFTPVIPSTVMLGGTSYSVTMIGDGAFNYRGLTSVTIPSSVTAIGVGAFYMNALTTVTIPDSVVTIGDWAFALNALTSVTIPNSVTTIGNSVFQENALTSVTIPNSVVTIGVWAFYMNALTSVTIPSSVTTIGVGAFVTNPLTTVTFDGDAPVIEAAGPFGSFGAAAGKTIYYSLGAGTHAGATPFATPTWEGYNTWISGTVAPVIQTAALPDGTVGAAYSEQIGVTGAPAPTFAVTAGTLPAGLTLSAAGLLSGTPTAQGASTFTITATNAAGADAVQFTVTVAASSSAPVIQTAALPDGTVGAAYSEQIGVTGAPAPTFAVTAGALPAGLTLSAAGLLSGTPTAQGASTFTITATNAAGADAVQYTVTVAAPSSSGGTHANTGGALANTGAEPNGLMVGAGALLLLGAGALVLTARGVRRAHAQR